VGVTTRGLGVESPAVGGQQGSEAEPRRSGDFAAFYQKHMHLISAENALYICLNKVR